MCMLIEEFGGILDGSCRFNGAFRSRDGSLGGESEPGAVIPPAGSRPKSLIDFAESIHGIDHRSRLTSPLLLQLRIIHDDSLSLSLWWQDTGGLRHGEGSPRRQLRTVRPFPDRNCPQ